MLNITLAQKLTDKWIFNSAVYFLHLKEHRTLKHMKYVSTEIFVTCLGILVPVQLDGAVCS